MAEGTAVVQRQHRHLGQFGARHDVGLLAPATGALAAQVIHVAPCDFYATYIPGGVPQRALSETYPIVMGYQAEAAERRKHPAYDDYWKQLNPKARAGDVNAPGFFVGG